MGECLWSFGCDMKYEIDHVYLMDTLKDLLEIPSPSLTRFPGFRGKLEVVATSTI